MTVTSLNGSGDPGRAIRRISSGATINLFSNQANLIFEKFHPYLLPTLPKMDALSTKVDEAALAGACKKIENRQPRG